ncbi:MAG TPA: tetratricopeptide repeat protein, partial [Anaerolineae bacterium]|nr:tetratricopeptide repeat protein [Anaerolineae bacterium]
PPKDLYRAYLDQSHIFVGIYWQRYGWVAPDMGISGLEDEYRLSGDKPKLIYIKQPAPDREPRLKELLNRIKDADAVSYKYFSSADELRELIENDLLLMLTEHFETAQLTQTTAEAAPTRPPINVPIPRNPLIGRERELATLQDLLLQDNVSLVTITGTGGVGKSRLALEIALNLRDHFDDGVFLVKLSPIRDANLVTAAIAETLDIRESTGAQGLFEMLKESLRDKRLLLLIDNFEQVIAAAPVAVQLLEFCPRLKILATSRVALRVRGEHEVSLPPLRLPKEKDSQGAEPVLQFAAVQLFVQRAQTANPSFALTDENAPVVVEICRRLDGLPLALELAAMRVRILSPQMLLARLENRLAILSDGGRDLPARQHTLHSAIDWSYDLLNDSAKALFRRLSVFVGGWTLEAAEAVCNIDSDLGADVLDDLETLVNNSLLGDKSDVGDEQRFGMLETIREYARERLTVAPQPEADRVYQRYAQYYLQMAEEAEPHLRTAQRPVWLARLEVEHNNLRAALAWSKTGHAVASELRLAETLTWFWYLSGYLSEGRAHLEHALAQTTSADRTHARAALLFGAGAYAETQADYAVARDRLTESVAIFRELGDQRHCAYALLFLALVLTYQDKPDLHSAFDLFRESIDLFRETKDKWGEAYALTYLGDALLVPDNVVSARSVLEMGLKLWRQVGDGWGIATHLFIMGGVAWYDGDYATARAHCQEAVDRLRQHSDKWGLARGLNRLGYACLYLGEPQPAKVCFIESLKLFQDIGNRRGVIYCLSGLGGVAAKVGWLDRAARVFGAIQALSGRTSTLQYGFDRARYQRTLALARAEAKDESAWNAAYAEGQTMTFEQAIACGLEASDR